MSNPKRRATYDDVRRAPEGKVAEIVDGELYVSPRPASPHARAAAILHGELDGFDGPPSDPDRPSREHRAAASPHGSASVQRVACSRR